MPFRKILIRFTLLVLIAGCASAGIDVPPPAITIGDKNNAEQHNDGHLDAALALGNEEYVPW